MRFLKKTKITTWLGKKQGMFTDQRVLSVSISFKASVFTKNKMFVPGVMVVKGNMYWNELR